MDIVKNVSNLEGIRKAIKESPLAVFRQMITDADIYEACDLCGHIFRDRKFGPVPTVFHYILHSVQREDSFAATTQEIMTPVIAEFPEMSDCGNAANAMTHARARLDKEVLSALAKKACSMSGGMKMHPWKGFRLLALDGTTVSMPRQPELFNHFGSHKARTTAVRYPLATAVFLVSVQDSLVLDWRFGPFDPSEKNTARPLLDNLKKGDLLLADRGFSGFPMLARIFEKGADFLMRKNARLKVEYLKVVKRIRKEDFIVELSTDSATRKKNPGLPDKINVRIFKSRIKMPDGRIIQDWFVTSIVNGERFKRNALGRLYHRRWQIETAYLEFKQTFHADVLSSKTVDNIYKEFFSHVLAYQLVRLVMCKAVEKQKQTPVSISFLNATRWVISFSARMSGCSANMLPALYEQMLQAIASNEIDVRPGRIDPRALTREWKHYPHLRISRIEWRRQCLKKAS